VTEIYGLDGSTELVAMEMVGLVKASNSRKLVGLDAVWTLI